MSAPIEKKAATLRKRRQSIVRQINMHKRAIAKHRDALRELVDDAQTVADCCEEAVTNLEAAADTLSQYL